MRNRDAVRRHRISALDDEFRLRALTGRKTKAVLVSASRGVICHESSRHVGEVGVRVGYLRQMQITLRHDIAIFSHGSRTCIIAVTTGKMEGVVGRECLACNKNEIALVKPRLI